MGFVPLKSKTFSNNKRNCGAMENNENMNYVMYIVNDKYVDYLIVNSLSVIVNNPLHPLTFVVIYVDLSFLMIF